MLMTGPTEAKLAYLTWLLWLAQTLNLHIKEKVTYSAKKLPCIDRGLT
jgi:hypothetical protein